MDATIPNKLKGFEMHEFEGETIEVLPMATITEFWIVVVSTFGSLYERMFTTMYSKKYKARINPLESTTMN